MQLSFGTRYILTISILLMTVLIGISTVFWLQFEDFKHRVETAQISFLQTELATQSRRENTAFAQLIADQIAAALAQKDITKLRQTLAPIVHSKGLYFLSVYDHNNRLIYQALNTQDQNQKTTPTTVGQISEGTTAPGHNEFQVVAPIIRDQRGVGKLLVGFSETTQASVIPHIQNLWNQLADHFQSNELQTMALAIMGLTVFGTWLIWWLTRRRISSINKRLTCTLQQLNPINKIHGQTISQKSGLSHLEKVVDLLPLNSRKMAEPKEFFKRILDHMKEALFVLDKELNIRFANHSAGQMCGCPPEALMGKSFFQVIKMSDTYYDLFNVSNNRREVHIRRQHGNHLPVALRWNQSNRGEIICIAEDITEQLRQEKERRLAAKVFENSAEGIVITDPAGTILTSNPATTRTVGYRADELRGRSLESLFAEQNRITLSELFSILERKDRWEGELWLRCKENSVEPFWLTITLIRDNHGRITHYAVILLNLSERKEAEKTIYQLAYFDPLTRLPNRRLFQDRLQQALLVAQREDLKVAVLFLDLDRFKIINDSRGHAAGDMLLQAVAKRLQSCIRREDTLARLGGDEFAVILGQIKHPDEAAVVAEKLLAALSQAFAVEGNQCFTSASIGISLFPDDASNCEQLLKHADSAMYHAKRKGRNRFQFFTRELNAVIAEQVALEHDLRQAIERNELQLYYQPQWHLQTGRIIGIEALLRWHHPRRGWIPPKIFIPLAEECGLFDYLGEWVLRGACRQMAKWQKATGMNCSIAVNISARQFHNPALAEKIEVILHETGLPSQNLELELTETVLMEDISEVMATLQRMHDLQVRLTIDDFGTGHSSLNNLKRFRLHRLKIDRCFIAHTTDNPSDAAIVETIISLGQNLDMSVLAEGVETLAQADFLKQRGCLLAQGWLFARPLEAGQLEDMLRQYGNAYSLTASQPCK